MKNKIGEEYITNEGYKVKIIEFIDNKNCDVQLECGTILKNKNYSKIKIGILKNPYHKSIYNIGFIGEGYYKTNNAKLKKHTKVYQHWFDMLQRCYSEKFHLKKKSYKNCIVFIEWHNFQNFAKWFEENYVEEYHLDKDILVKGNKIYGPDTCCFVPQEINKLILNSNKTRGEYPIGVRKMNNKFQAYIRDKNNQISLGVYNTIEKAFIVYKEFKENKIKKTAIDYYNRGKIGLKLYNALYNYKIEIND